MSASRSGRDPYTTLGVSRNVPEKELRTAYRRLVREHHPDHNNGSLESTRRFEEIQEAYSQIVAERRAATTGAGTRTPPRRSSASTPPRSSAAPPPRSSTPPPRDPALDARIADLERQLREAQAQRERAREEARKAAARAREAANDAQSGGTRPGRATDEDLGYFHTDDSLSQIISDAIEDLGTRFDNAREHPTVKRVEDLIEELEQRLRPR